MFQLRQFVRAVFCLGAGFLMVSAGCTVPTALGDQCDGVRMSSGLGLEMFVGDSLQLSVIRRAFDLSSEGPGGCIDVFDLPYRYIWQSSNREVAIVDAEGVVRALSAGQVTISAKGQDAPHHQAVQPIMVATH